MYKSTIRQWLLALILIGSLSCHQARGQAALIAMVFGDKVASEDFNLSMEIGPVLPMYTNVAGSERAKIGLNFGIAGNIKLSENWFLSPNAYFLAKRSTNIQSFSPVTNDATINVAFANTETQIELKYIDLPVFIHYQTTNKKYRVGLAPQISFLRSAEAVFSNNQGDFTEDVSDFVNSTDFGMIYNLTYVLGKAHKGRGIHVHLRYHQSFSDAFSNDFISGDNRANFFSLHVSLPFLTDELAEKNLE